MGTQLHITFIGWKIDFPAWYSNALICELIDVVQDASVPNWSWVELLSIYLLWGINWFFLKIWIIGRQRVGYCLRWRYKEGCSTGQGLEFKQGKTFFFLSSPLIRHSWAIGAPLFLLKPFGGRTCHQGWAFSHGRIIGVACWQWIISNVGFGKLSIGATCARIARKLLVTPSCIVRWRRRCGASFLPYLE